MPSSSGADAPIPDVLIRRKKAGSAETGGSTMTLVGIVEQGVEARSIVLRDGGGSSLAQLVGQPAVAYPFGARVEVIGRFLPGLRTIAQQGTPFRVDEMKVL